MNDPSANHLRGVDLRLRRAREHLAALHEECRAFLDQEDRRVIGHFDSNTSEYVFRVNGDFPDAELGLLLSEFGHHLRASLDNLLWQLVLLRGAGPTRSTQFPIYERRQGYRRRASSLLRGISSDDRALIEWLQPYHWGPDQVDLHPLARLAWLNNTDKHRFLHFGCTMLPPEPVFVGTDEEIAEDPFPENLPWWPRAVRDVAGFDRIQVSAFAGSQDGAELIRVHITPSGPNPEMQMQDKFPIEITLSNAEHRLSLTYLDVLWEEIEGVVALFRPRFAI